MALFSNVQLTPADLPQPPTPQATTNAGTGGGLEYYGPGNSGAHASPNPNAHAEVSPVFGEQGGG